MSSEPTAPDEDGPTYRVRPTVDDVPGLVERVLEHLHENPSVEDFTFEGVDIEIASGVWLIPIGAYDPDEDTPSTPEEIAAGASPTGPWGNVMRDWETGVRRVLRELWGEPVVHMPRLVGSAREPEGILDYLLLAQEIEQAELWDRGEVFAALLTRWSGDPAASPLLQALVVLPRTHVLGGMAALVSEDATAHELLMYGEHPLELHRRAWLMSTLFDRGEVRLRDAPIEATRCSLQARDGTTTVWIFADDGRQLVLVHDPSCMFAELGSDDQRADVAAAGDLAAAADQDQPQLLRIARILDGVPHDLLGCVAARGPRRDREG